MAAPKSIGDHAEELALEAYLREGAHLLARNYRVKCGELDLVLEDPATGELVIVEVRARDPLRAWESPAESLTPGKLRRIRNAASIFLLECARERRQEFPGIRFDLAAWDGSRLEIHRDFWWY